MTVDGPGVSIAARMDPRSLVGQKLGKYAIEALIAEGSYGAVFRAKNFHSDWICALKVFREPPGPDQDQMFDRFVHEGKVANSITDATGALHPAVVTIVDVGHDQGWWYLAMELLRGETLKAFLARSAGPVSVEQTRGILRPAMEALALLHMKGITNRDVKPENLFLMGPLGSAHWTKLLDFGIARVPWQQRTGGGRALGTARYMAPEQFRGSTEVGTWSDVWALGLIVYEMLTGKRPYGGDLTGSASDGTGR